MPGVPQGCHEDEIRCCRQTIWYSAWHIRAQRLLVIMIAIIIFNNVTGTMDAEENETSPLFSGRP